MAQIAAQQLQQIGMDVTVDIPAEVDWGGQMAFLINGEVLLMQTIIHIRYLVQKKAQTIPAIPMNW